MNPSRKTSKNTERKSARGRLSAVLLTLATVLCAIVLFGACNEPSLPSPSTPVPVYDLDLSYDGGRNALLDGELLYTNDTGEELTSLAFHLYANAFSEDASSPPCLESERADIYYNGDSFGNIELSDIKIDRKTADFELNADKTLLTVRSAVAPGGTVTVSWSAEITLPECNARFGVTQSGVNFTGFYPVLCMYDDGEWRTEGYSPVGDPFFSEISSFHVTLAAPTALVPAASGEVTSSESNGGVTVTEITAENVRDFALFLSRDFGTEKTTANVCGSVTDVTYFYTDDADPSATAALAAEAIEFFSAAFGAYPYPSFTLVQAHVGAGGMEYGALAAVDPSVKDEREHALTVVHETAHQWWFGVVGSDQINSPWLDEGLTEFSAAYFFLRRGDEQIYTDSVASARACYSVYSRLPEDVGFDGRMDRPLSSYLTAGEYVAVAYCKGLLLFDTLLSLAGEEKLDAALADYYAANAFSVADGHALAAAFSRAGFDAAPIISSFVRDTAVM